MKIYGVVGWKNAGKTSLIERLVAEFCARGLRVSTIKHVHHDVDLDHPGKDSHRHRSAGASEVILAGAHRFALLAEHRAGEPPLAALVARLAPVDLVLVEGYKRDSHPKIEVWRQAAGHDLIAPSDPTIRAVASDCAPPTLQIPKLDLNNTAQVADFIAAELRLGAVRG
ncbi:MAG: molybdopterin-guanine dinucleotide biosynthesis protein B [Cypionkella sp.]|nr:molybdopterin-guanine dinucleotide biosynthesis protein B [Cypionkella sp.]